MKGMKSFGKYGALGFELLMSMAIGYYGGLWLDRKLGTRWIALLGFLVGCYAGFRAIFRAAKQMERDIEREERLERGEDPWAAPDDDDDDEVPSPPEADGRTDDDEEKRG
jgi:ATP synthase protein I